MSTAFRVRPELPWDYLFANLPEGVREEVVPATPTSTGTTDDQRALTNGVGYLWAYKGQDGADTTFERFGVNYNAASEILEAIENKFNVQVLSEHDEGFWDDEDEEDEEDIDQ